MRFVLLPFRLIYFIYCAVTFLAIMLIIFPFVIIATFFGRIRGGNLIYHLCRLWGDAWFPIVFIFPRRIYEAPHDKAKPYIFVTNHISYLDAAFIVKVFRQPIRPLGKVEMSKVPVFGYIYRNVIVAVDRSNAENRAKSILILRSIIRKGISVLVFPEGTFNMTPQPLKEFYDGAFRLAIETQIPIKPVLFLDTYSRMNYKWIFSLNPGRCRAVYLAEIPVTGLSVADTGKLKEKVFSIMEEALRRYGVRWVQQ